MSPFCPSPGWYRRISAAFRDVPVLPLCPDSRYVLFSDCHRGVGNSNDNFLKNQHLYLAALQHYIQEGYTYIELGDGDELWENRSFSRIIDIHDHVFQLLKPLHCQKRLYMLYGNHDHCKKFCRYCRKHCTAYHPACGMKEEHLFPDPHFYSGLILKSPCPSLELYLTHGHQADFLNSTLAPLTGFLVRYLWRPLEHLGVADPTSAARNYSRKKKTELRLTEWACREQKILITGHTHRPMAGSPSSPYFNTGSCVHPCCITCLELKNLTLTLVKWTIGVHPDLTLSVSREVLASPVSLFDFSLQGTENLLH